MRLGIREFEPSTVNSDGSQTLEPSNRRNRIEKTVQQTVPGGVRAARPSASSRVLLSAGLASDIAGGPLGWGFPAGRAAGRHPPGPRSRLAPRSRGRDDPDDSYEQKSAAEPHHGAVTALAGAADD